MKDNEQKRLVLPYNKGLSERICLLPLNIKTIFRSSSILRASSLMSSVQHLWRNRSAWSTACYAMYVNVAQCTSGRRGDNWRHISQSTRKLSQMTIQEMSLQHMYGTQATTSKLVRHQVLTMRRTGTSEAMPPPPTLTLVCPWTHAGQLADSMLTMTGSDVLRATARTDTD